MIGLTLVVYSLKFLSHTYGSWEGNPPQFDTIADVVADTVADNIADIIADVVADG